MINQLVVILVVEFDWLFNETKLKFFDSIFLIGSIFLFLDSSVTLNWVCLDYCGIILHDVFPQICILWSWITYLMNEPFFFSKLGSQGSFIWQIVPSFDTEEHFLVILDELNLALCDICATCKCSVKAVNQIISVPVSHITTSPSFRITYPLRVHYQEDGASLLFPHNEGGGVFHRDSLLEDMNSFSRRNPRSLSYRAAAKKRPWASVSPDRKWKLVFLPNTRSSGSWCLFSSRTLMFRESAASLGHFFSANEMM